PDLLRPRLLLSGRVTKPRELTLAREPRRRAQQEDGQHRHQGTRGEAPAGAGSSGEILEHHQPHRLDCSNEGAMDGWLPGTHVARDAKASVLFLLRLGTRPRHAIAPTPRNPL